MDENCLGLFKTARAYGYKIPQPMAHVYLSRILDWAQHPGKYKHDPKMVVNTTNQLERGIRKAKTTTFPSVAAYRITRTTAEVYTVANVRALMDEHNDLGDQVAFPGY
jgi:hypothetical protein